MSRSIRRTQTAGTLLRTVLTGALLLFAPRLAFACPVCFGENDSPLASGINYGIVAMLVIILGLWIAFASFFLHLRRRARQTEAASAFGSAPDAQHHLPERGIV